MNKEKEQSMRKCLGAALAVLAALLLCAFAGAEGTEDTREAELFDLWNTDGESMTWISSAAPVSEGILIASMAGLPEDADQMAITDGANIWDVKAVVPDSSGLLAILFFDVEEALPRYKPWELLQWAESVPVSDCYIRSADERGSRINSGITDAEETRRDDRPYSLMTLTGPVPPGSPLLTREGKLAGFAAAEWITGKNRYLVIPAAYLAEDLVRTGALLVNLSDWGEKPEGFTVTRERNRVTLDWSEMTLPEKAEGEALYLVLLDTANDYLNFFPAETDGRRMTLVLTPGRFYMAGIVASSRIPEGPPEQYAFIAVPRAEKLTEYGFRSDLFTIAEAPAQGLGNNERPVPVEEVTEELLRSGRAYFYSASAYEVTETVTGKSLLVTLTDPEGVNYRYTSAWIYAPEYMQEDVWFVSLKESGLTSFLDSGAYPKGVYQMAFYVDGDLADTFYFELK